MILDNLRISRKFVAAFAVLVLTCLGAGGISLASLATIERTSDAGGRGEAKLGELQKLELALMSQQNALRGFMISGAANFVADFESQRTIYLAALGRIRAMETDPDQQARLDRTAALVEEWMATSARKQLEAGRDAETRKTAAPLVSGQFFTRIRSGLAEFAAMQNTTVTDLAAAEKKAAETARIATSAGALTAVTLASLLCWLLTRSIARPIEAVTIALRSLADGNEQLSLPAPGRQDELGRMTDALHVLRDAVGEKRRLEQAAEATRHEHAAQQVRIAAERESAAKDQGAVMAAVTGGIHRLSSGDLTARLDQVFPPEYETLRTDFNAALARLQTVMAEIVGNTRGLQAAAGEVSQAADDLSRRTEQQAASLEQTAAALEQVTVTVRRTAEGALEVRQVVSTARADAEQSGTVVQDAVGAMSEIERSAREISQIIGVIDEIAFQTNLLALNAGVEAARAGDAGRGFAVVASEVRALAQRSADAAKQIKGLISTSTRQVSRGVDLVGETGKSLSRIVAQVIEVNTLVTGIAASAQEQSTGLAEVNAAVNQMDQITQQNAAMVEQSTAASHALSQDAAELARLTGQFVIGTAATERPALHRSAAPKASAPRPVRRAGQMKPALAVVRTAEPNNWTEF